MITLNLKSFEKTYSKMDLELEKNFPKVFSLGELIAYNSEFHRGYGVAKVHNTTNNGTVFTYTKFMSEEHIEDYQYITQQKQLNLLGEDLINEINLYKKFQLEDIDKLEE